METKTESIGGARPQDDDNGDRWYRELRAELARAGCFEPTPARNVGYAMFILAAYAAAYTTLLAGPGVAVRAFALVTLAFVSVHAGFLAHEAGHGAVTRDHRIAAWITQVFNTLLTALCASYYRHIHRRHHPRCNDRDHDPDMQSAFFSMYAESARAKVGFGRQVSRYQHILIWILVWLQPFTLKIDSVRFLKDNPRATRVDQAVLFLHVAMWFVVPTLVVGLPTAVLDYVVMSLLIGPYLGTIFLVNHIGTRVIEPDDPISFFSRQVTTTRNLGTSRRHDFFFGGINNHIEHHLFPSIPTARLRTARPIVRAFCRRHGIVYRELTWLAAAREVTGHFRAMSAFVPRP